MEKEKNTGQEQQAASEPSEEPSAYGRFLAEAAATGKELGRQPFFAFPTRYAAHELTVDRVSFRVFSQFNGEKTLDKLLASLMLEDVNRNTAEEGREATL